MLRPILPLSMMLALAACAAPRPDPAVFTPAEEAIAAAVRAGAEELAPTDLKFAREKLDAAHRAIESKQYDIALWLIEESEVNSELAIEQSRTALSRRKASEASRANEILREELRATYGEDFQ